MKSFSSGAAFALLKLGVHKQPIKRVEFMAMNSTLYHKLNALDLFLAILTHEVASCDGFARRKEVRGDRVLAFDNDPNSRTLTCPSRAD